MFEIKYLPFDEQVQLPSKILIFHIDVKCT